MAISAFFLSGVRFRKFMWLLILILICAYIYVLFNGRIEHEAISRFRTGVREGFSRGLDGLRRQGGWDQRHGEQPIKPPRNVKVESGDGRDGEGESKTEELTDEELKAEEFTKGTTLVKNMMRHAWDGYRKYAWGEDELRPLAQGAMGMLGPYSLLVTIVDSLDTLMIMRLDDEYIEARDYLFNNLNFDKPMTVSLFESNIRLLGGLLSAFALSGDGRYITKAFDLAQRFMFNFNEVSPFPHNTLNLLAHTEVNATHYPAHQVHLAEIGTFSLEFAYLSDILNDKSYIQKATKIIEHLSTMRTGFEGLFPATIVANQKVQPDDYFSLGGLCDSFYEYLLKYWLYTAKRDTLHRDMYRKAVDGIKKFMLQRRNGRTFMINRRGKEILEEQEHLACFVPGMLALGAVEDDDKDTLALAEKLAESCYMMYHKQKLGLSPEFVNINTFRPTLHRTHWS